MSARVFGAIFIIVSCGGFGFLIAANHKKESKTLRQFIHTLEHMECELQYRLTPLPELCRSAALATSGTLKQVYLHLAEQLETQISPDAELCMKAVIQDSQGIPKLTREALLLLGISLGHFDVDGQVKSIIRIRKETSEMLAKYTENQDVRLRCYQTLGLCAGAAIAILLI